MSDSNLVLLQGTVVKYGGDSYELQEDTPVGTDQRIVIKNDTLVIEFDGVGNIIGAKSSGPIMDQ